MRTPREDSRSPKRCFSIGRVLRFFMLCMTVFMTLGCGSVLRLTTSEEVRQGLEPSVYYATRFNAGLIKTLSGPFKGNSSGFEAWGQATHSLRFIIIPWALVDMPLALVLDTVLLPADLYNYHKKDGIAQKQREDEEHFAQ